jgi:hypothetical protein
MVKHSVTWNGGLRFQNYSEHHNGSSGVGLPMKVLIKEMGYSFTNYGPELDIVFAAIIQYQLEPRYCLRTFFVLK